MSPEGQRVAIAEACPDLFECHQTWQSKTNACITFLTRKGSGIEGVEIDPLNDLNAMHEAEKVLTKEQHFQRMNYLNDIVPPADTDFYGRTVTTNRATAAQRAEAFLKTINLWDSTK